MGEKSADFADVMEQYIKEMKRYYARRTPMPERAAAASGVFPEAPMSERAAAAEQEETAGALPEGPIPEKEEEPAAAAPSVPEFPPPETPPEGTERTYEPETFTTMDKSNPLFKDILPVPSDFTDEGNVVVKTHLGDGVIPLEGSNVAVYTEQAGKKVLLGLQTTDEEGRTPKIIIKTVGRDLSKLPGRVIPYTTCFINAWAPNYYPVVNREVEVFSGETSLVEIEMVPLPEERPGTPPEVRKGG